MCIPNKLLVWLSSYSEMLYFFAIQIWQICYYRGCQSITIIDNDITSFRIGLHSWNKSFWARQIMLQCMSQIIAITENIKVGMHQIMMQRFIMAISFYILSCLPLLHFLKIQMLFQDRFSNKIVPNEHFIIASKCSWY